MKFHKHSDRQYRNLRDRKTYGTGKNLRDRKTYGTGTYRKLQENQVKQDRGYLVSPNSKKLKPKSY